MKKKRKFHSESCFILAITFLISSLIWLLWNRNIAVGLIWLCIGVFELVLAMILRTREQNP